MNIWNIQGNRGDMQKIYVTRQFFKGSGRHGDLIEKTKNPFLDKVNRWEYTCQISGLYRFLFGQETGHT